MMNTMSVSNNELILIRGLPGSGKSSLARKLVGLFNTWDLRELSYEEEKYLHFENDMYHTNGSGVYVWKPENVRSAATWCFEATKISLTDGFSVIVSNTFTRNWEMDPYRKLARELDIPVTILTCEGNYGNIHNVSDEIVERMRKRWEPLRDVE